MGILRTELFSVGELIVSSKPEMSAAVLYKFSMSSFSKEAVYKAEQAAHLLPLHGFCTQHA